MMNDEFSIRKRAIVLLLHIKDGQHTASASAALKKRVANKTRFIRTSLLIYLVYRMKTMTFRSKVELVSVDSSLCTLMCKSLSMFDRFILSLDHQKLNTNHSHRLQSLTFSIHKHIFRFSWTIISALIELFAQMTSLNLCMCIIFYVFCFAHSFCQSFRYK